MRNEYYTTWNMVRKLKNVEIRHKHVGPGVWRETLKNVKNVKYTLWTWSMAIKLKNEENETKTLYDLENGKIKKMNKNVKHVENETKKKQFALEYGYSKT